MSFLNFNFWLSKQDKPECNSGFVIVYGGEEKAMKCCIEFAVKLNLVKV